jgi:uncharacterized protein
MKRSGVADLPLHGGCVPQWLAERMTKLGTAITEAIVQDYGASVVLSRLSDPFWFQALGAVMGMDWHSSGFSRNTPQELRSIAERRGFDGEALVRTSRLTARIDNNAIADGFQIYLHSFVVTSNGEWAVVQQGLNDRSGMARRYHWHSASVRDFVAEPHTGIVGENQGTIMNLVDAQAKPAQTALLDIARENPETTLKAARHLRMPRHHEVRAQNIDLKRLGAVLAVAYNRELHNFAELLLLENLGPRTLQSLALIAEVVHGAPSRFSDPARFSFAHGGKDRHPFPVPLKTYDESLNCLRTSLDGAKVGDKDKLDGLRRLECFVRAIETRLKPEADFDAVIAHENAISRSLDGRSVFDDTPKQLPLF